MWFSVVTVTLNPGNLLDRTVESIMNQSCPDWELVVQDGGSQDGALGRVPDDPRIRIVEEPDEGIYDAMNRALSKVRGDYVLFLNAGDSLADHAVFAETFS